MPTREPTAKTRTTASAKPAAKTSAPKTVDDYISAAPKDRRATLMKLRKTIQSAAPKATALVGYGIAGFKQNGQRVAYFAYWKEHFALYGTSGRFIKAHAAELEPYLQSKGTIQFPADKPLPYTLVTKIVKGRVAEIEEG